MTNRLKQIASHITGSSDDVVITMAVRTPLGKGFKGSFKDTPVDMLILTIMKEVVAKSGVDPALVDDICVGNVLGGSSNTYASRAAALAAGFPSTTSVHGINRWCSSGLLATQTIANAIRAGEIDIGLAMGCESMSQTPDRGAPQISEEILKNQQSKDCTMPMGWTSENVAQRFNVSRQDQDAYAATSFQKAEAAQKNGYFDAEIVPVTTTIKDKEGKETTITVTKDDGVRWGTTAEGLSKLKPAFKQWGNGATTGGNASQITDGAAGVLLMRRSKALELGVPILARFVAAVSIGCDPDIMGIGPALSIPKVLKQTGLNIEDVDIFELNEAFASQFLYSTRVLNLPMEKVNPNGGAIALGHRKFFLSTQIANKQVLTGV